MFAKIMQDDIVFYKRRYTIFSIILSIVLGLWIKKMENNVRIKFINCSIIQDQKKYHYSVIS